MNIFRASALAILAGLLAVPAAAHVSERALVLILPTDIYMLFGVAAVVVTVFLTLLVPAPVFRAILAANQPAKAEAPEAARDAVSLIGFLIFAGLLVIGIFGSRDPLVNLLPLAVFNLWWICLPLAQALFGDIWGWINPWRGPVVVVFQGRQPFRLPRGTGVWPALATYVAGATYVLTDIAPDDPDRLAWIALGYWLFTFMMCGLFGRDWLHRGEGFTVFFDLMARIAPIRWRPFRLQFPGVSIIGGAGVRASVAVFSVTLLALGSFDGLNETFWWMARLGINPLEFPGRSAVIWPNRIGMAGAVIGLNLIFAACVWLGLILIGRGREFGWLWRQLALTLLPIALGYHMAHYLTSALVGLQYLAVAANDPFQTGNGIFGLTAQDITTSFFNQHHTVRRIWLTQASAIVIAHMIAVILSHGIALREFGSHRLAVASQLPVAGFMVAYTFFGLWLLASPVAL